MSDPATPVPYRERPISPTYPGGDWPTWESADQRLVDHRPDVLSFVSEPLEADLTVAGEVSAALFASTSGPDCDFVVKLIDVFPEEARATSAENALAEGPKPAARVHVTRLVLVYNPAGPRRRSMTAPSRATARSRCAAGKLPTG